MKSEKRKVKNAGQSKVVLPVDEKYDWINPSRAATDKEIEQMLNECEKSPLLSSKEARKLTMKEQKGIR